ncbi:MAG TPA: hypothetical protein VK066_12195 [Chloroflexota bacterium]|nr:hypothetical protein [Chloroflexota bacterium]
MSKQASQPTHPPGARGPADRRSDELLRSVVQYCRVGLEEQGFALDRRGGTDGRGWVRFSRPDRDARGHGGTLVLLVAHGRPEQALLFDTYFVDRALDLHTPHAKLLQWYDGDAELPSLVRQVVDRVRRWPS